MLCYVMLTFKLVELTSKVQEQLVFQKNQAACDKSSVQGLRLCWLLLFKKIRLPSYWQYLITKNKFRATKHRANLRIKPEQDIAVPIQSIRVCAAEEARLGLGETHKHRRKLHELDCERIG